MRIPRCLLVVLGLGAGCNSTGVGNPSIGEIDQALVLDGNDAMTAGDTGSSLNSITTLALSGQGAFTDTDVVVGLVERRSALFFEPAGCLATTRDGNSVTFAFDGCRTGAFGFNKLIGQMTATYDVTTPGGIGISIATAPNLMIGNSEVVFESESFASLGISATTLVWNGRYQATRPVRPDIDHESSYTITFDTSTQCLRMDGSATSLFNGEGGVETFITNYERCGPRGTCPTAGELSLTRLPDRERGFTLEYDGDATAYSATLEAEVDLECTL